MSKSKPGFSLIFASVFAFVFQLIFPLFIGYGTVLAAPEPPEIAADSYLLADLKTGRVFMSKDIDSPRIPASLTKIMTLFIAFDEIAQGRLSFDDEVSISEDAWRTGGSTMFLLVGTQAKVSDLIQGITVASGNDACVALAEHISGNATSFVDKMNQQAQLLGLTNTHFVDPHGLSDENSLSAQDFLPWSAHTRQDIQKLFNSIHLRNLPIPLQARSPLLSSIETGCSGPTREFTG